MLDKVFEKYKENFKYFVIFFILSVAMALVTKSSNITALQSTELDINYNFKEFLNAKNIVMVIVFTLLEVYIATYGLLLSRKAIKEEPIHMRDSLTEVFFFYPRILGLSIIFIVILILSSLLIGGFIRLTTSFGFIMFNMILYLILIILFGIFTHTIQNYLVYYDESIGSSIKGGIIVGKRYFFRILGLIILASLIGQLPNMKSAKANWMIYVLGVFILSIFNMFINLYITNLCKVKGQRD
ncbi:hypothetical protein [Clostridium sp. Cult3]|uniref:hypothetical protein n=1 Tax=Clostridium sp. Cult3 TaxID=2079004 RepID=UPI001F195202|nr:hypothetical protein [Clostridium sp. Cult3]MCF6459848.1 hypothetical protein [Clostridium sp. Cult3]